jgi:thioredoxin 1
MMKVGKRYIGLILLALITLAVGYRFGTSGKNAQRETPADSWSPKVTFVELGSVNCIPCRAMQPVMRSLEMKYGNQIKIVFHDVWKDDMPAKAYGIRAIPTQVFLDEDGREFHRHEGFYPLEQIETLLLARGLRITNGS